MAVSVVVRLRCSLSRCGLAFGFLAALLQAQHFCLVLGKQLLVHVTGTAAVGMPHLVWILIHAAVIAQIESASMTLPDRFPAVVHRTPFLSPLKQTTRMPACAGTAAKQCPTG